MDWLVLACCLVVCLLIFLYLRHVNQSILKIPEDYAKAMQRPWTDDEIRNAYLSVSESPIDVLPFLFSAKQRRYIIVGGSGLVGSTIATHLIQRGENPAAIRIVDISQPTRTEVVAANIGFVKTDITDAASVSQAFEKSWPTAEIANLPLTVFHTAAKIGAQHRKAISLAPFVKVNVNGTKHVIEAAKTAGVSCLIATSSASVGLVPYEKFPWPWQTWPKYFCQIIPNADRENIDDPLSKFCGCYAWSKSRAEMLVRNADDRSSNFRTGCIRPGHAIYGVGVNNPSSLTWDYLRRGGAPSWIWNVVANFVCADNVSIGHLAYENALLEGASNKQDVGGRAYCVTDPNPPITYGLLYRCITMLTHANTPARFTVIPYAPILLFSYVIETLDVLRMTSLPFLPEITGDLIQLQPALHDMCSRHIIYDDQKAKTEIGYKAPISTLSGFAAAILDWNRQVEARKPQNAK